MQHRRRRAEDRQALSGDLFIGDVRAQALASNERFRVQEIVFVDGARTRWHTHSFPQVLVITEGAGTIATDDEEVQVEPGDVLDISPGTRHWHGAHPGTTMVHLSINGIGDTTW